MTAVENELRPFELEWAGVDDARAVHVLAAPELERVRHYLESRRRFRPTCSPRARSGWRRRRRSPARSPWERLFSELLSSIRVPLDGEEVSLDEARERLRTLTDKRDRQTVAEAITQALEPNIRLRALVLNTVASDRAIDDGLRGYPTWISERNLQNEIADSAAEALIDAVVSRYDVVHRHFRLRSSLLGLPKLADYDRFAPVEEDVTAVDWDEARALAVEAFGAFSPQAGEIVDRFFDEGWIDAAPRAGKVPGAYCAMQVARAHPFILMNFTGSRDSALTLAHELGHGVHAVLAADRGYLNLEFPLTFVEAASVFGETLVFQALLERATSDRERLELLVSRIDGAVGTVFGTVTWNRLEDAVHTLRRMRGRALRRADQRAVGDRRACDERRRGRGHAGLSHVVELRAALRRGARVHVRVRVRLPAVALRSTSGIAKKATHSSSRFSTCCARARRTHPDRLARDSGSISRIRSSGTAASMRSSSWLWRPKRSLRPP